MAETFKCNGCKEYKLREAFYSKIRTKSGLDPRCKECRSKDSVRVWAKQKDDPVYIARRAKIRERHREKLNTSARQWYRDNAERVKAGQRYRNKTHPEKTRAHNKVRKALIKGLLTRPSTCSRCGRQAKVEAHHHLGYDLPYEVTWLCRSCHRTIEPH